MYDREEDGAPDRFTPPETQNAKRTQFPAQSAHAQRLRDAQTNPFASPEQTAASGKIEKAPPKTYLMNFGVIVFPGSNCDHDAFYAVSSNLGQQAEFIWHDSTSLNNVDVVILPGGFSYGDYLRCGAIAKFSPVMQAVKKFAADGGPVLGVCNGFQILVEAGLLPGALLRNEGMKFLCKPVQLSVETTNSAFTSEAQKGQIITIPIAHGEGNYFADQRTLDE